jgi:hypothetical protein
MPAAIAREMPSGSIVMAGGVAMGPPLWRRGCGSGPDGSPDTTADRRAHGSTTPATGDRADHSSRAGAEQTATEGALGRIVRVCPGCRRKHQSGGDDADNYRWGFHSRRFFRL